jgi:hypothetical protein
MRRLALVAGIAALGIACCPRVPEDSTATMEELGSRLTYVTAQVKGAILDKSLPESARDREVFTLATKHDPDLAKPFDNYVVRVLWIGNDALLLVCTKDGQVALLEDATCTPRLDGRLWETTPRRSCEFVSTGDVCTQ